MSVLAYQWAWNQTGLKSSERVVLLALCEYADDKGVCWPSQVTLARRCEMRRNNLNGTLKKLADKGLISIHRRGQGRQYQLNLSEPIGINIRPGTYNNYA